MGSKGIVAASAAIGVLLQEGIGDTIRYSLTPEPGGDRTVEVKAVRKATGTVAAAAEHQVVPVVGRERRAGADQLLAARLLRDIADEDRT